MSRVSGIVKLVKNAEKLSKTVSKSKPKRNIDLPNVFDTNLKTPKTNTTSIFENSTKIPSIESPFNLPEGITFTKQPKRILKVDGVKQEFGKSDVNIANLETVIAERPEKQNVKSAYEHFNYPFCYIIYSAPVRLRGIGQIFKQ